MFANAFVMRMPRDEVQTRRPGVHLCPFEVYADIDNYRDQRRTEPSCASRGHKFVYDLKPAILNSVYLSLHVPYETVVGLLIRGLNKVFLFFHCLVLLWGGL